MIGSFLFLGTGASVGVPVIGCTCAVCASTLSYNQRLRPSGLITIGRKRFLIDVGPDFRQQALKYGIDSLDCLLVTHTHFDHIAGIDELRIYYLRNKTPIPCILSKESHQSLKARYPYLFKPIGEETTLSAQFDWHLLPEDAGAIEVLGINISYFSYFQGAMKVTGYRIGDLAYVTDIRDYNDSIFHFLKGVRILILGALWDQISSNHFSLGEAVAFARKTKAVMTRLTHMNHTLDYQTINQALPSDVKLGYDGLEIEFAT